MSDEICETCNGEGSIDKDIEYPNGSIMSAMVECPDCN
jgi:DnaJ-class molecular chaperone